MVKKLGIAALRALTKTRGPPRGLSTLERLPDELLVKIHFEAGNICLPAAARSLSAALAKMPPEMVAEFFLRHCPSGQDGTELLSEALVYPIVGLAAFKILEAQVSVKGTITPPGRLKPSHTIDDGARQLLMYLLDSYKDAQGFEELLPLAVETSDHELAALLFLMGVEPRFVQVMSSINKGDLKLLKILLQHPVPPSSRPETRGMRIRGKMFSAAVGWPEVAAYLEDVRAREHQCRQLIHRAAFGPDGECVSGHDIGKIEIGHVG